MNTNDLCFFRLAKEDEFEAIYFIWHEGIKTTFADYEYPTDMKEQFWQNFSNRSGFFNFWIAESKGKLVGWCSILPMFLNPIKRAFNAEISTYLDKRYSSNGIGQSLMRFVFNELKKSNIKVIYGFVNKSNLKSTQMALKSGMSVCGETSNKIIMIKEIQ